MITAWMAGALGLEPTALAEGRHCDSYWERRQGEYGEGRLYTTYCASSGGSEGQTSLTVGARWEGPSGEEVSSELVETGDSTIDQVSLTEEGVSFRAASVEIPHRRGPTWTSYVAAFDPVAHTFAPAVERSVERWEDHQQRLVDERLAEGESDRGGGPRGTALSRGGHRLRWRSLPCAGGAGRGPGQSAGGAREGGGQSHPGLVRAAASPRGAPGHRAGGAAGGQPVAQQSISPREASWPTILGRLLDAGGEHAAASALLTVLAAAGGEKNIPLPVAAMAPTRRRIGSWPRSLPMISSARGGQRPLGTSPPRRGRSGGRPAPRSSCGVSRRETSRPSPPSSATSAGCRTRGCLPRSPTSSGPRCWRSLQSRASTCGPGRAPRRS